MKIVVWCYPVDDICMLENKLDQDMARVLYALAYPTITFADRAMIDGFRDANDLPFKDVVAPHFTIGFGCDDVAEDVYLALVGAVTRQSKPIAFHCRYAMLGADDEKDVAYVFLVPDEGNSAISLLHDRLYAGPLAAHLRLDIPYVPHITIGTLDERQAAKSLCEALNSEGVSVVGTIESLTVSTLDGRIEDIATFKLGQ